MQAQVIWTSPLLPIQTSTVTVFFDANEGNGALASWSGTVYAHTGVITNNSSGPADWKFVQGNWGTDDADVAMTPVGGGVYSITYGIDAFYGAPGTDTILDMAFVFRNEAGDIVGRAADGGDIYTPVFQNELSVAIIDPISELTILEPGENLDARIAGLLADSIFLFDNGTEVIASNLAEASTMITPSGPGTHELRAVAKTATESVETTKSYFVRPPVNVASVPAGADHGINVINDSTVTLVLYAPEKDYVFLLADWNGWTPSSQGYLSQDPDGETWWTTVTNLESDQWYAYQYLIDGSIQVADYMAELVLDPSNDPFISEETFPDLPAYPEAGSSYVSVLRTVEEPYTWNATGFTKPAQTDLVVYELLVRDFVAKSNFQTVIDSLDYLKRLGINAIELMPINEFEGNNSWGYNPAFHGALDKYYGTKNAFKAFVDTCHANGIAVILDMVMNHAFGQSPMVRMYYDGSTVAANSPWLNPVAKHDFNVGFDYNHESQATKKYMKDMVRYWVEEYQIDGYRMDLSKGFTQNNTLGNTGAWGAYDASRVAIWKDYADELWSVDPDAYLILEHFADNDEEKELAAYGMMVWGNVNYDYRDLVKGFGSSNVSWGVYTARGYDDPRVVSFMESHDEERLMYDALTFGNTSQAPDYNVRNFETARQRAEMGAALFFPIPGPKMIWQFGELGYDVSIDFNGRTGPKPIRWDFYENDARRRLFQVYSELIKLRSTYDVFRTTDFSYSLSGTVKRINLNHPDMNVTVLGNVGVVNNNIIPSFQHTGWWYDFLTGDSIDVSLTTASIAMEPGEYHVYTDVRLATPELLSTINGAAGPLGLVEAWPNPAPAGGQMAVSFDLGYATEVEARFVDMEGRTVSVQALGSVSAGQGGHTLQVPDAAGFYLLEIAAEGSRRITRIVVP